MSDSRKLCTIGLDFGSLSCRGVLVCASDGEILVESEYEYPHGVMSTTLPDGTALPPQWALQSPDDYLSAMENTLLALSAEADKLDCKIVSIGIDTTASTVIPVNEKLEALCTEKNFAARPNAWPKMWKHHAAKEEAVALTEAARKLGYSVLSNYGGTIGAEFYLPKVLQVYNEDPEVFSATYAFLELGDWLTSLLVGEKVRSAAYLSCKAMWDKDAGYPSSDLFDEIQKGLSEPMLSKLIGNGEWRVAWPGECAGELCSSAAAKLGLTPSIKLSAPQMDGYAGLPGCGIYQAGKLMMAVGTSTSFILLSNTAQPVKDVCASVNGSVLPGFMCHAAGQPCTGDMFRWFIENQVPEAYTIASAGDIHGYLTSLAEKIPASNSKLIALDWWNGNKSCLNNSCLSGVLVGLTLSTKPEHIYRALLESAAFGARIIAENFEHQGVAIDKVVASGGISLKNPLLMQIYADILQKPVSVCSAPQAAALGSAIYAASAAGLYPDVIQASKAMGAGELKLYTPRQDNVEHYNALYEEYKALYDYFGRKNPQIMYGLNVKTD